MNAKREADPYLPTGTQVMIRRWNGEEIRCKTAGPHIPHLLPIGEFYLLVKCPDGEPPFWRGSGRKSKERLLWEASRQEIGMRERPDMKII